MLRTFAARAATSPALAAVQEETLSAIQAELEQALRAAATAPNRGPDLDPALEARLLLATVDGLMLDAVSAPGTLTPADLEAALDAHLDRLLPASETCRSTSASPFDHLGIVTPSLQQRTSDRPHLG